MSCIARPCTSSAGAPRPFPRNLSTAPTGAASGKNGVPRGHPDVSLRAKRGNLDGPRGRSGLLRRALRSSQ
jgi:hypothetical protein